MPFDPEAIEAALFALIEGATSAFGFKEVSRRFELWPNTGIEKQDALYLIPAGGDVDQEQVYGPPRYRLKYWIAMYSWAADDRKTIPQQRLNAAWKAIDAAMREVPPGEAQTLGGIVTNAWIDGHVSISVMGPNQQLELAIPVTVILGI